MYKKLSESNGGKQWNRKGWGDMSVRKPQLELISQCNGEPLKVSEQVKELTDVTCPDFTVSDQNQEWFQMETLVGRKFRKFRKSKEWMLWTQIGPSFNSHSAIYQPGNLAQIT